MTVTSINVYQQITSVRLATTANLSGNYYNGQLNNGVGATLTAQSVGALNIDGVDAKIGDRVLLKNQTSSSQNGIYIVKVVGSAITLWVLQRAPDFQNVEQLKAGQYFSVGAGNTLAGAMYIVCEPLPSIIGIDDFNFIDVATSSSGTYFAVANNLSESTSVPTLLANIGQGSGDILELQDSDFVGGIYTLSNPAPIYVRCFCNVPGNQLRLPSAIGTQALAVGRYIEVFADGIESVDVKNNSGTATIVTVVPDDAYNIYLTDNSTPDGTWREISTVNSLAVLSGNYSGIVSIDSDDLAANASFTPVNYTPAAGTGFSADSITGYLKGIDNAIGAGGTSPIAQQIWVNDADGNDSNSGDIDSPLKTIPAAITKAKSIAAANNIVLLKLIGDFSIVGNLQIAPFVYMNGENTGTVTVSGNVVLDADWDVLNNPNIIISDIGLDATGIDLQFTVAKQAVLQFSNINYNSTSTLNVVGTANAMGETIVFDGYSASGSVMSVTMDSANFIARGMQFNGISFVNVHPVNAFGARLEETTTGNISVNTLSGGTEAIYIRRCEVQALSLNGANVLIEIDSSSYQFVPSFAGGASTSNIQLKSLTDGVLQTNYTPVNYTPTAGTNYQANSLTGNLRGIDEKLLIQSWDGFQTPVPVVAGAGIDITGGTISATGTPSTVVSYAEMYMSPINSHETDVGGTTNWTKVEAGPAGPSPTYSGYAAGEISGFSFSNGRLTCNVPSTQRYKIMWTGSVFFASGSDALVNFQIFKNGSTSSNSSLTSVLVPVGAGVTTAGTQIALQGIFTLASGDYIECYLKNQAAIAQNPIVKYTSLIIEPVAVAGSTIEFVWNTITADQNMAPNEGYLTNSGSLITLTLPSPFVAGEIFAVSGVGSGGWKIVQNAGQQIITENGATTVGAGGYLQNGVGSPKDSVTMVAIDTTTLKVVNSEGAAIIVV